MSRMKNFAMKVSEEMGFGGDLTDEVLVEAQRRLDAGAGPPHWQPSKETQEFLSRQTAAEHSEEQCLRQTGELGDSNGINA
jgi:hypothetical protein